MVSKSDKCKQARRELIQQALDEICETPDFNSLYSRTYCVLAKFWLHIKAEKENLFKAEEWSNPKGRDELLKKIKEFLIKHIR